MTNLWGGTLHRVTKANYSPCFECGGPLRIGEYVHVHCGGMVIIHCRHVCGGEIQYESPPKERVCHE